MRRFATLLLSVVLLIGVLAGCTSLKDDEKGAVISMYLSSYPQTLDPGLVQLDHDVTQLLGLIFQSLTAIDNKGNVVGALAYDWYPYYDKVYGEYKMYFKLKETGWSDKRPVSADDVVYAWTRILDPDTESPYAAMLYPIKNAKDVKAGTMTVFDLGLAAVNSDLLEITFEEDYDVELFAETVSSIHLAPLREDIVVRAEKNDEDWAASAATIICNGPYRIQGQDEGEKLVLERNAYYLREEDDHLDKYVLPYRIVCLYQEDMVGTRGDLDEVRTQIQYQTKRFEEDNIFYLSGFDKDSYSKYSNDIETMQTPNAYVYYFNNQNELLADHRVRAALSVAINRQKLVDEVTATGEQAATGFVPPLVFDKDSKSSFRKVGGDLYNTSADIDKAKGLLSEAKVRGGSFTLTYLIPESKSLQTSYSNRVNYSNVYEDVAKSVKADWETLGFTVTLKGLYPDEFKQALYTREYDVIGLNNIINSTDAFAYLAPFAKHYSGSKISIDFEADAFTLHYTNFDNDEYEELVDSVVHVSDRAKRAEILHTIEAMLVEQSPATALFYYNRSYVMSDKLSKVEETYFGYNTFDRTKLKNYRDINAAEDAASGAADK